MTSTLPRCTQYKSFCQVCDKLIRIIGLSLHLHYAVTTRVKEVTVLKNENNISRPYQVPIWHKATLSMEEAMAYTGIGRDKLREMTNREDCPFILWNGSKRLIKRKEFDEYLSKA